MKKIAVFIITLFSFLPGFAMHIAGGELFYEYVGAGSVANTGKYKITMRLFRSCLSKGQTLEGENVVIGIYNNNDLSLQSSASLTLQYPIPKIQLTKGSIPCLVNAPDVCYEVGVFTAMVDLPVSINGYTLSWIRCCRIDNITNMSISTGIGATFTTQIPGTDILPTGNNSSPQFVIKDTALVCQNTNFVLDFGASDPDGDSLSYSFCNAYLGGSTANPNPGSNPRSGLPQQLVLTTLPYRSPFTGNNPLGSAVSINSLTGKITGTAPAAGLYVINVCVSEWRNGKVINEHHKDFILAIGNCDFAAAEPLPLAGAWCKDFSVNFSNNNTSSSITGYLWDFGVTTTSSDISTLPTPVYTYADTGVYTVKLIVQGVAGCIDSASTTIGVYPGFTPDFSVTGSCFQSPFVFKDLSTANYGVIDSWSWDFGDLSSASDTSSSQNPSYKYPVAATENVQLTITSSKGCIDTVTKPVAVTDVALLTLPFKDTLICSIDTLQLQSVSTGTFNWTPAYNIINNTSANPLVFPKDTTTYVVTVIDPGGCINKDSIKVNVLGSISVYAGADTTICQTDIITLQPISAGLQYQWTPVRGLLTDPATKNQVVQPASTTTYFVTAKLGKCIANDNLTIKVAPYPQVNAGPDVTICYGNRTQLTATIAGAYFTWTPQISLLDPSILSPIAGPMATTEYTLTVTDTIGCPKAAVDTVAVTVIPPVNAFAGNDTTIVANQPLQLNATGGTVYTWSPAIGMNDPLIANPIVIVSSLYDSVIYKVRVGTDDGCFAEDELKVTVFKTAPDIFIPSGFTPNSDGRNDVLKPLPVGIKTFNYFRIYNRWGQMIYSTASAGTGWDGTLGGKEQATGTYVYMAQGIDYLGKTIFKKGTVVLIR